MCKILERIITNIALEIMRSPLLIIIILIVVIIILIIIMMTIIIFAAITIMITSPHARRAQRGARGLGMSRAVGLLRDEGPSLDDDDYYDEGESKSNSVRSNMF